jgi:hypothetical protein
LFLRYNGNVAKRAPSDLYFVNAPVDAFFVGLASILCFLYYRYASSQYSQLQISESAILLATTLGWFGSWPHFAATNWRLYQSKENIQAYFLTAVLVPVVVLLAGLACFVFPVSFAPAFIKLFALWSPYHYSSQTFGLALIYFRRADLQLPQTARHFLAAFFASSFLVQYSESEIALGTAMMSGVSYPQLALPAWAPLACKAVMYLAMALLAWQLFPLFRKNRIIPWIALLPLLTQYLWFVHGAKDLSFQLLLPFFHGLQYLLVAWAVEIHKQRSRWLASGKWMAGNLLASALVFFLLPKLLTGGPFRIEFVTVVVLATVSIHHYFVDGVIWKLRHATARSPLFVNIGESK